MKSKNERKKFSQKGVYPLFIGINKNIYFRGGINKY